MGAPFAPLPHESKSGDRKARNPRKNAAQRPNLNRGDHTEATADLSGDNAPNPERSKKTAANAKAGQSKRRARNAPARGQASRNRKPQKGRGQRDRRDSTGVRRGWIGKKAYAALDLGTNNCRLLIARATQDGFTIVDAFSRVVRLGEGLASNGKMSDAAMDRAVEALRICAEKLKKRNVVIARSVATEACRQADNGAEFIDRVARETGILLDIIPPREEARLAVLGCYSLLEAGDGPALIFDIGGGSTELILVDASGAAPVIKDWVSVPWGVVSLTESFDIDDTSEESRLAGYAEMRRMVRESFAEFESRLPRNCGTQRLMGTSGTVTTLSSVYLDLPSYNRSAVDGLHLPTQDMRNIAQAIAACSGEERTQYPTIGTDRADLVVAGCAIMEAIFDIWPGARLGVADRGIREGILRALIAGDQQARRPNYG